MTWITLLMLMNRLQLILLMNSGKPNNQFDPNENNDDDRIDASRNDETDQDTFDGEMNYVRGNDINDADQQRIGDFVIHD